MDRTRPRRDDDARATEIAVLALAHVAQDDTLTQRFVATTGMDADQIRTSMADPAFLAGVLEFILAHEPDAAAFAAEHGLQAEDLANARRKLNGGDPNAWLSA